LTMLGMKALPKFSFSTKTTLLLTALMVLILGLVLMITYSEASQRLKDEFSAKDFSFLEQAQLNIETKLRTIDTKIQNLMNREMFTNFVRNRSGAPSDLLNTWELSKAMPELGWSIDFPARTYIYSRVYQKVLTEDGSYQLDNFFDPAILELSMSFPGFYLWTSVRQAPGPAQDLTRDVVSLIRPFPSTVVSPLRRNGAVIANIDAALLGSVINGSTQRRLGSVFIVNGQGEVLAGTQPATERYRGVFLELLQQRAEVGRWTASVANEAVSVTALHSAYTGWYYVSIVSDSEINAPLKNLLLVFLVSGGVLFLVMLFGIGAISQFFIQPLGLVVRRIAENWGVQPQSRKDLEGLLHQVRKENELKQEYLAENLRVRRWKVLQNLLAGDSQVDTGGVLELGSGNLVLVLLRIEAPVPSGLYLKRRLSVFAENLLADDGLGYVVEMQDMSLALLIRLEALDTSAARTLLVGLLDILVQFLSEENEVSSALGVSSFSHTQSNLNLAYQEALAALDYRILGGRNSVIFHQDVEVRKTSDFLKVIALTHRVAEAVKAADAVRADQNLDEVLSQFRAHKLGLKELHQTAFQMMLETTKVIVDFGVPSESVSEEASTSIFDRINAVQDVGAMRELLSAANHRLIEQLKSLPNAGRSGETIHKVLDYIRQNYAQPDLSLKKLSDVFALSVPYLSKIFKESTGTNFLYFLIKTRMDQAQEILAHQSTKVVDVAGQVGYPNTHSFNRVFRQYAGVTPGEYRERFRKNAGETK